MGGNGERTTEGEIVVQVTIKEYLARIEGQEALKPPAQRCPIPTVTELAEAVGVSRATMYNLVGGHVQSVNLKMLGLILKEFRQRGFNAELSDLLTAYPAELAGVPA